MADNDPLADKIAAIMAGEFATASSPKKKKKDKKDKKRRKRGGSVDSASSALTGDLSDKDEDEVESKEGSHRRGRSTESATSNASTIESYDIVDMQKELEEEEEEKKTPTNYQSRPVSFGMSHISECTEEGFSSPAEKSFVEGKLNDDLRPFSIHTEKGESPSRIPVSSTKPKAKTLTERSLSMEMLLTDPNYKSAVGQETIMPLSPAIVASGSYPQIESISNGGEQSTDFAEAAKPKRAAIVKPASSSMGDYESSFATSSSRKESPARNDRRPDPPSSASAQKGKNASTTKPLFKAGSKNTDNRPTSPARSVSPSRSTGTATKRITGPSYLTAGSMVANDDENAAELKLRQPVRVSVRVRPFLKDEKNEKRTLSKIGEKLVVINPTAFEADPDSIAAAAVALDNKQWAHIFEFDKVLWDYNAEDKDAFFHSNSDVHDAIGRELVDNVCNGVSSTCFAYGHTSTGKTYSLFGNAFQSATKAPTAQRMSAQQSAEEFGLAPHVFKDIIETVSTRNAYGNSMKMYISFIEIYNDKIRDLLSDNDMALDESFNASNTSYTSSSSTPGGSNGNVDSLKIREHPIFGPYVENLQKVEVESADEAFALLYRGMHNRSSSKTCWNANSSRSHAIVCLELAPASLDENVHIYSPPSKILSHQSLTEKLSHNQSRERNLTSELKAEHSSIIRLQMVDLAGSEKEGKDGADDQSVVTTKSSGTPRRQSSDTIMGYGAGEKERKELKSIRKSLSTLGYIVKSLSRGVASKLMPFRDSMLTYLLKDALTGAHFTSILATITPASGSFDETLATLRYCEQLSVMQKQTNTFSKSSLMSTKDTSMSNAQQFLREDFPAIHNDLGGKSRGDGQASRKLLQQTLSDPQQRIAKMSKVGYNTDRYRVGFPAQTAYDEDGNAISRSVNGSAIKDPNNSSRVSIYLEDDASLVVTTSRKELDELTNTIRTLQTQMIESQIDLDAVRTDRDTLLVELRNTRDQLNNTSKYKDDSRSLIVSQTKALKIAEAELTEIRKLLRSREDSIERLMADVADEKILRENAESTQRNKIAEYVSRFETMKREMDENTRKTENAYKRMSAFDEERDDLVACIQKLKENVSVFQQDKDVLSSTLEATQQAADEEQMRMQADIDHYRLFKKTSEELRSTIVVMEAQRDEFRKENEALIMMAKQKDELLSMQQHQADTTINILNKRAHAVTSYDVSVRTSGVSETDFNALQDELKDLLSTEGNVLHSELVDTKKLTYVIRHLRDKVALYHKSHVELGRERDLRQTLESQLEEVTYSRQEMAFEISQLRTNMEATNTYLNDIGRYQVAGVEQQLRTENSLLRDQLAVAHREIHTVRNEVILTKDTSQREFSTLWKSVQDLNQMDALKDRSIHDLVRERDTALTEQHSVRGKLDELTVELTSVHSKLYNSQQETNASKLEVEELKKELQEVDQKLLETVQMEEASISHASKSSKINHSNSADDNASEETKRSVQTPTKSSAARSNLSESSRGKGGSTASTTNRKVAEKQTHAQWQQQESLQTHADVMRLSSPKRISSSATVVSTTEHTVASSTYRTVGASAGYGQNVTPNKSRISAAPSPAKLRPPLLPINAGRTSVSALPPPPPGHPAAGRSRRSVSPALTRASNVTDSYNAVAGASVGAGSGYGSKANTTINKIKGQVKGQSTRVGEEETLQFENNPMRENFPEDSVNDVNEKMLESQIQELSSYLKDPSSNSSPTPAARSQQAPGSASHARNPSFAGSTVSALTTKTSQQRTPVSNRATGGVGTGGAGAVQRGRPTWQSR